MSAKKDVKQPVATVMGSLEYGWQQMWKYFLYLFLVIVVIGFAESPASMIRDVEEYKFDTGLIFLQIGIAIYWLLVLSVINYGADLIYLRAIQDKKIEMKEMFNGFKNNYINIILANLLTFAIIGLGFVFFIIPGIIFACRLAFVSYLVMDKNMEPVAAVEKSWAMTRGHGWKIFGLALMTIPLIIGGLICFIVGVIFAVIWICSSFAALYHAVDLEDQKHLEGNGHTYETEEKKD